MKMALMQLNILATCDAFVNAPFCKLLLLVHCVSSYLLIR